MMNKAKKSYYKYNAFMLTKKKNHLHTLVSLS
jgi:hypothetical protein